MQKENDGCGYDAFLKDNPAADRLIAAQRATPQNEAQGWLERADTFARKHQGEHLLIAIRYFEIADRFNGSPEGKIAQDKSLNAMKLNLHVGSAPAPGPERAPADPPPKSGTLLIDWSTASVVEIAADARRGYELGPVKAGSAIGIRYLSGK